MTSIEVFCDGGARGNPGPAAIGFVIKKNNKTVYKESKYIGKATNNIAEYQAVLKSIQWLVDNQKMLEASAINFYIDSQLVVQQLSGNWKIKNDKLKELVYQIKLLESKLPVKVFYKNVPRFKNTLADSLVNLALDKIQLR